MSSFLDNWPPKEDFEENKRVIVCHGGVTFENRGSSDCKRCCNAGDAVHAVEKLEDCGSFNAGRGSSLTRAGTLEMEAAVFIVDDKGEMQFGAVGVCSRLKSPVQTAFDIAWGGVERRRGLIDPMVLVGPGVEEWAEMHGGLDEYVLPQPYISPGAKEQWERAMERFDDSIRRGFYGREPVSREEFPMDTVGAVDLDLKSWASNAACSSGGILIKKPGRLGHCTVFGAGVWVEQREWTEGGSSYRRSVSICLSGCGEAIVRTDAARTIARMLCERPASCPNLAGVVTDFYDGHFHEGNRLLARMNPAHLYLGGVAIVRETCVEEEDQQIPDMEEGGEEGGEEGIVEMVIFHNTPYMPVAWKDRKEEVHGMMSKREGDTDQVTVTVMPL